MWVVDSCIVQLSHWSLYIWFPCLALSWILIDISVHFLYHELVDCINDDWWTLTCNVSTSTLLPIPSLPSNLYLPKCSACTSKSKPERICDECLKGVVSFALQVCGGSAHDSAVSPLLCGVSRDRTSLIRNPLPQKEARHRPIMAITTTEQAAGTAWLLPRNWLARSPAKVELCIPVQRDIVLLTSSSCLKPGILENQYPKTNATAWNVITGRINLRPSAERIWLRLIESGLPMQSEVHTIATNGITGRRRVTTGFA